MNSKELYELSQSEKELSGMLSELIKRKELQDNINMFVDNVVLKGFVIPEAELGYTNITIYSENFFDMNHKSMFLDTMFFNRLEELGFDIVLKGSINPRETITISWLIKEEPKTFWKRYFGWTRINSHCLKG